MKRKIFALALAGLVAFSFTSCGDDDDDATIAQPAATEFLSIADELSTDDETQSVSLSKTGSTSSLSATVVPQYSGDTLYIGGWNEIDITLSGIEWKKVGTGVSYTLGMGLKWEKVHESGATRRYRLKAESPGTVTVDVTSCIGEGRDAKVITIFRKKYTFAYVKYPMVVFNGKIQGFFDFKQVTSPPNPTGSSFKKYPFEGRKAIVVFEWDGSLKRVNATTSHVDLVWGEMAYIGCTLDSDCFPYEKGCFMKQNYFIVENLWE